MFVFKSWKESITNAELVHQEEEAKLRLSTEHAHLYFMDDTVLQAGKYLYIQNLELRVRRFCIYIRMNKEKI